MNTAEEDQVAAAARELEANRRLAFGPGLPEVTMGEADPLYRLVSAALDAALDPAHPERRCPHVGGVRPYMLDPWRRLLSCGQCRRTDQRQPLPGDEDYRCDRCRALVADADQCFALMAPAGFITTAVMLCPACWRGYSGKAPGRLAPTAVWPSHG